MKKQKSSEKVFFELLKAGLWSKANANFNDNNHASFKEVDWGEVYRLAEEQSVIGLITTGLDYVQGIKAPQEWTLQLIGTSLQLEQQNKAMNDFLTKLVEKLRKEGVYTLLVKGQGVAQCYDRPLWRACGDVDLFLSDDNYAKARRLLTPLASSVGKEYKYSKHLGMTIDGWEVELHGSLRSGFSSHADKVMDELQADTFYGGKVRSWMNGHTQIYMLGRECDVLYVFTHFLGHFYKEGLGLRQVCDWCRLLWTYRETLDLHVLESWILKARLMSEWKTFGAYAVDYLGMEAVPFLNESDKQNAKLKKKAKRINNFILSVGNMGHNRDANYMKYPYMVRKCFSAWRRIGDMFHHSMIFPMGTLRFFPKIMLNGIRSAVRGE